MMEALLFALGGLTALVLWWLLLGPLFHGFIQGLMNAEPVQEELQSSDERPG